MLKRKCMHPRYARTSSIIIPVLNTDPDAIWTLNYRHSDVVPGCQRYPGYRDTWVHTEVDEISLRTPSRSGYFGKQMAQPVKCAFMLVL